MGSALVEGVVKSGAVAGADVVLNDSHGAAAETLAQRIGGKVVEDLAAVLTPGHVVLVCVKPGQVAEVLQGLSAVLREQRPLVVSIAAGVSLVRLQAAAGPGVPVARVMPNTPALVGCGASAFTAGAGVGPERMADIVTIFGSVGLVEEVQESLIDAVTGTSGSGPAFVYTVIEAMADGGCLMGLPKEKALRLAAQTVAGAAQMVLQTGLHPGQLRDQVTSPGGTTIAGLAALELAGLRGALISAVEAAATRSMDMALEAEDQ